MGAPAHTQIILFQYFKNDDEDPLAWQSKKGSSKDRAEDWSKEKAQDQLGRMVESLKSVGLDTSLKTKRPRNYSYPQFETQVRKLGPASTVSEQLQQAAMENEGFKNKEYEFAGEMKPWVSIACLMKVRPDQKADHLNFNQFLALVVELPFLGLVDLRHFLEKWNYKVLKKQFLETHFWRLKNGESVSSMPTYVLVGNEAERPAIGHSVIDIPTPVYNPHTAKKPEEEESLVLRFLSDLRRFDLPHPRIEEKRSFVERGYPYVNYIVHETLDHFIQLDYEYVDLGLSVFLHGYLDRETKQNLQARGERLSKLMKDLTEADDKALKHSFDEFRQIATDVAEIRNRLPEIEMMGRRLTQKYLSPDPQRQSIFQMVQGDNDEFLKGSVEAVAEGIKLMQDLFLVVLEKKSKDHQTRIENFLKVVSAFAVVLVLKEIWAKEYAPRTFEILGAFFARHGFFWPVVISGHPAYFYACALIEAGILAVLWSLIFFDEKWSLSVFGTTTALGTPLIVQVVAGLWLYRRVRWLPWLVGVLAAILVFIFNRMWTLHKRQNGRPEPLPRLAKDALLLYIAIPPCYLLLTMLIRHWMM